MTTALLPCPFCAWAAEYEVRFHGSVRVVCSAGPACSARPATMSFETREEAAKQWNNRVPPSLAPGVPELVMALREAREAWASKDWDSGRAMRCRERVDAILAKHQPPTSKCHCGPDYACPVCWAEKFGTAPATEGGSK